MATETGTPHLVRTYLRVAGAGLATQGVLTVLFLLHSDEAATRSHGLVNHDARHGALHLIWGAALLLVAGLERRERRLAGAALIFGVFYTGLGLLGIVVHHPFGFLLGPGENGFHLIVGTAALAAGVAGSVARSARAGEGLQYGDL